MMREQTFSSWLQQRIESCRMAMVTLYEKRDHLRYVEAPPLRKKYMDRIGAREEAVLQAELEVSLLRKKVEWIQISINRREPVDLDQIDARLEVERQLEISQLEGTDRTLNEIPTLTEAQEHTLQRQYREIIQSFHPAMNLQATDTQRELYAKALEAYKRQDVDAIKLIHEALFKPVEEDGIELPVRILAAPSVRESLEATEKRALPIATDYALAETLYDCFIPTENDTFTLNAIHRYEEQRRELEEEIAEIRAGFPFNAVATMEDPAKTEEYLAELRIRARRCEAEKAELEGKIADMTGGHTHA